MYRSAYFNIAVTLPGWAMVLMQAKEWGVPPWEIEPGRRWLWSVRWQAYRNEQGKAERDKAKHG